LTRRWIPIPGPFVLASAALLVGCLLLGGGTRVGFLSDALLQLFAIPLLLTCIWRLLDLPSIKRVRWVLIFSCAVALVPLIQLIPLPPQLWASLPNREGAVAAFALLGQELPWMPISVSPHATWLSALSLLPPAAVLFATMLLGRYERRLLSLVVLGVGIISVFIGLAQVAQGPQSALRFFEITNLSEAVGFFANRNHFASLLYALSLLAAAWAVEAAIEYESARQQDTGWIVAVVAGFAVLVALVAAQAMARSRAGLGLTMVALFGAFALAVSDRRNISGVTPIKLFVGAIALASVLTVQYALYKILDRFAEDPLGDARLALARNTIALAKAFMPFGSGMGTFVPVYANFERPEDAHVDSFANHAHNDVLELWLEAGVAGIALMAIFLGWLVITSMKIWRHNISGGAGIDWSLSRAATMIIGLIGAHSFVDYPLRTSAMMAILAFACGLLIEPCTEAERTTSGDALAHRVPDTISPLPNIGSPASLNTGEQWGKDVNWPKAWRDRGSA